MHDQRKKALEMFVEYAAAFLLILGASFLIYLLGRRFSPKPTKSEGKQSPYVCGEQTLISKPEISVSLYKYLIFFAIVDASVLLIAYASIALEAINVPFLLVYLGIVFVSSLLLVDGDKE